MSKTERIDLRVTPAEKLRMEKLARQAGENSLSGYIRKAALNKKIKSQLDADLVLELIKMNADLSRLGNLLKLTMNVHQGGYTKAELAHIETTLRQASDVIKEKVMKL